jgi:hypothetical protein
MSPKTAPAPKQAIFVKAFHSINLIALILMTASGLQIYRTHLVSLRTKYIAFRQPLIRQFNDLIGSWGFAYQNE